MFTIGAPVYISNPHFYLADPDLLDAVEGLKPNQTLHESYFKIQPVSTLPLKLGCIYKHYRLQLTWFDQLFFFIQQKLGVPLEGKVRVQLNLKVDQSIYINSLKNFRSFVFPVIWVEEVCIWKIIIIQLHPKRTSSSQKTSFGLKSLCFWIKNIRDIEMQTIILIY